MTKKIISLLSQEEFLVPTIMIIALLIAFSPFLYEVWMTTRFLPEIRYPLLETDFPPDQRVYLSRMRQGLEGQWLVAEKYIAESHRPSIFHISYLLMGKLAGWLGLAPPQAFTVWRLIASLAMMIGGYFFLLQTFSKKWQRLSAFLLFIFVGNLPRLTQVGIPLLGLQFTFFLGWYTFFDPVKRLFFLPHYNLAAGFLSLSLAFLWRGVKKEEKKEFIWAGIFALIAGVILPTNLVVNLLTAGFFFLAVWLRSVGRFSLKNAWLRLRTLIVWSWPFWLLLGLGFLLFLYSLSYFPWSVHSQADIEKRFMGFNFWQVISALGTTGLLGLIGGLYVLVRRKTVGYLSAWWLLAVALLVTFFRIFPVSNAYRPLQVELHLPLAVTSLILIEDLAGLFRQRCQLVLIILLTLLLLPSLIVWAVSLKSQRMFIDDKVRAGYPLIPKTPYVVYPVREVMEAIFWLRDETDHETVVLAGETLGSMIPAYAGNFVYLGHGNQTVDFKAKLLQMRRFYQSPMYEEPMAVKEQEAFLKENRIKYVFWGPGEQELTGSQDFSNQTDWRPVFQNSSVTIFQTR